MCQHPDNVGPKRREEKWKGPFKEIMNIKSLYLKKGERA